MLDPELIEHLESDATLLIGTVDPEGVPEATYAWGLQVLEPGEDGSIDRSVRVLVPDRAVRTRANLETSGRVAATVTDVLTLRSAQLKGRCAGFDRPSPADERRVARQVDAVLARIHEADGTPMDVLVRFRPGPLYGMTMTVDEVFEQTPGPRAGTRLAPS